MPYIDGLPVAASVSGSDLIAIDQGGTPGVPGTGVTRQATVAMMQAGSSVSSVVGASGAVTLAQLVTGGVQQSAYLSSLTGAVSRSVASKLGDITSVEDFGADPTGADDSTAAINAALTSGAKNIYLPAGTYKTSATITLSTPDQKLIGAGRDATVIQINSTSASGITVSPFMQSFSIVGLTVTRVGTPATGASGINASGSCSHSAISDVSVVGHWVGIALGPTDYSTMENCFSTQNLSHGVLLQNTAAGGTLQWYLFNTLSAQNGGSGFFVQAVSGPSQCTLGTWTTCATFGNSGTGISFADISGVPIQGVRILGGFFGQDGSDEIALATRGSQNIIRDAFLELAGTGPTGPNGTTSASNVGNGISTTSTVLDISITGCHINQMSQDGLFLLSSTNHVVGNVITNCGQALSGQQNGISLGSASRLLATGNTIGNNSGVTSQLYGIAASGDGDTVCLTGNDLTGNTTGPLLVTTNLANATLIGNFPITLASRLPGGGLVVGPATGDTEGSGTINVANGVFKNGTAYTNP